MKSCLIIFALLVTVQTVFGRNINPESEFLTFDENLDINDNNTLSCYEEAFQNAINSLGIQQLSEGVVTTFNVLRQRHEQCLNLPLSDPPRPFEEAAKQACINAVRTMTIYEINRLRLAIREIYDSIPSIVTQLDYDLRECYKINNNNNNNNLNN